MLSTPSQGKKLAPYKKLKEFAARLFFPLQATVII